MTTFTIFEANKHSRYAKQAVVKQQSAEAAALEFAQERDVKDNTKLRVKDLTGRTTEVKILRHAAGADVFYTSLLK